MFYLIPIDSLGHLVFDLLSILLILIFLEIIVSYLICFGRKLSPYHPFVKGLRAIVDPIVNPIRSILPRPARTFNIDFAPMIAMIIIQWIRNLLY